MTEGQKVTYGDTVQLLEFWRGLYKPGLSQFVGIKIGRDPWRHIGPRGRHQESRRKVFDWFMLRGYRLEHESHEIGWQPFVEKILKPVPSWLRLPVPNKGAIWRFRVLTLVKDEIGQEPDPLPDEAIETIHEFVAGTLDRTWEYVALTDVFPANESAREWVDTLSHWGYFVRYEGKYRLSRALCLQSGKGMCKVDRYLDEDLIRARLQAEWEQPAPWDPSKGPMDFAAMHYRQELRDKRRDEAIPIEPRPEKRIFK